MHSHAERGNDQWVSGAVDLALALALALAQASRRRSLPHQAPAAAFLGLATRALHGGHSCRDG